MPPSSGDGTSAGAGSRKPQEMPVLGLAANVESLELEAATTDAVTVDGGVFTRFVRSLNPQGKPPDEVGFDRVWQALRGLLHRELRQRGLWLLPPSYLGVDGWGHWTESAGGRADALDELVADCYSFNFVQRIVSLRAQLQVKPNIEGLIYLNVGHFVHELQQRNDPLGTRQ